MSESYFEQLVPSLGVNESEGLIQEWTCTRGQFVNEGEIIALVETTKVTVEVEACASGYIDPLVNLEDEVSEGQCVALISLDEKEINNNRSMFDHKLQQRDIAPDYTATKKAELLAAELGVDLSLVAESIEGIIRSEDVEKFHENISSEEAKYSLQPRLKRGFNGRVLVIGGGKGATQLLSILVHEEGTEVIGILDDTPAKQGKNVKDVPILGVFSDLDSIARKHNVDSVICSVSTSIDFRRRVFEECNRLGIEMANAIHPSAVFDDDVVIGKGNFIGANCYFGNSVTIGNYSFISSGCIFEHHNVLGDGLSTGPSVSTSGSVTFGSNVRIGTGVYFEPNLKIGDHVVVSSGSCVVSHVPDDKVVLTEYAQRLK